MLAINETARRTFPHSQSVYFDGPLELAPRARRHRSTVDDALPRLFSDRQQDAAARRLADGMLRSTGGSPIVNVSHCSTRQK